MMIYLVNNRVLILLCLYSYWKVSCMARVSISNDVLNLRIANMDCRK